MKDENKNNNNVIIYNKFPQDVDEYFDDICTELNNKEEKYLPNPNYMSKQKDRNYKSYMHYSKTKEYMSFRNYLKKKNYVDVEYIYNTLASDSGELPFDYDTFKKSKSECIVVVTNAETGEAEYFTKKEITRNNYGICAASSNLPLLNQPYIYKGQKYFDGSISDPIPIEKCFENKCDKIILILTRPIDYRKNDGNKKILYKKIKKEFPKFANKLENRCDIYNKKLDEIMKLQKTKKDNILIIAPSETSGLKTLTKDYKKMQLLYEDGYNKGRLIEEFLNR